MPASETDPQQAAIIKALRNCELMLQHPTAENSPVELAQMIDPQFSETGASGHVYDRDTVLHALARHRESKQARDPRMEIRELSCRQLAADVYLLTYLAKQPERITRRASLWRRTGATWRILYHQGTPVTPPRSKP